MEQRTKRDLAIINLVSEFESQYENGSVQYLDEKAYYQLIRYYEEESQWSKALDVVNLALNQFKYRSDFYLFKAKILFALNENEQCLLCIQEAEHLSPNETEVLLLKAKALSKSKRFEESLAILSNVKKYVMASELTDLYLCESFIFEMMKDYDTMYEVLKKAIFLDPKHEEALDRMLLCTGLGRKYEESIVFFKHIIEIEPYSYLAWYNLGYAYNYIGEYEKAINAMEYSFIINPDFESGYLECAELCLQENQYERAFQIYEESNNIFGPDSELITNMAHCFIKMGKIDKTKYLLAKAIRLDPYNDEAYFLLGECYSKESNWYSAINAYHKAVNIDERCEDYYFGLAKAYVKVENYTKAVYNFNKATKNGPEQSIYWSEYVSFLLKIGLYEEALDILDEAEDYTFGANLLYCRAITLFYLGKRQEGMLILEEALTENFEEHNILFQIAPELEVDKEILSMIKYFKAELDEY
ncbi:MAG TPA: CDC27 family protein [Saprospiraceae bacterium]|mgnify:CR=1 FL=1|nr:CDC27 family protein [Saprospiraceae bacterium]